MPAEHRHEHNILEHTKRKHPIESPNFRIQLFNAIHKLVACVNINASIFVAELVRRCLTLSSSGARGTWARLCTASMSMYKRLHCKFRIEFSDASVQFSGVHKPTILTEQPSKNSKGNQLIAASTQAHSPMQTSGGMILICSNPFGRSGGCTGKLGTLTAAAPVAMHSSRDKKKSPWDV